MQTANPTKKRKLSAEDAGDSPASKHYCGISGAVACLDALPQERVEGTYSDSSGAESAHGSNSYGDACFHRSAAEGEGEVNANNGKGKGKALQLSDYEATSASSWSRTGKFGCGGDTSCSSYNQITGTNPSGGDGDEKLVLGGGNSEFHEEHVDEFGYCLDYILSATEEEDREGNVVDHQEYLYDDGIIPRSFLMSSENCYNDEDFQRRLNTRGPTIDQEFEEYFSSLML